MSQQPTPTPPPTPPNRTSTGLTENLEGLLCYVWILGLIFLFVEKNSKFVRFHAIQSVGLLIVFVVLSIIPFIGLLLWIPEVIIAIFMMVQAYQGKMYKLPILGNIAENQIKQMP